MDAKNTQESPCSQSSPYLKEKLNDEKVHDTTPPSSPNALDQHPLAQPDQQIPKDVEEPRPNKTYTCRLCRKTFTTYRALGGHQNGHRGLRALAKREAQPRLFYQPYPTNYPSYPNYRSPLALNQNYVLQSGGSTSSSVGSRSLLEEFHAEVRRTLSATTSAPLLASSSVPPEATNTKFFGVQDFFAGASSASGKTPSNGAGKFMSLDDDKEIDDASGLDLDLKL